MLPMNSIPVCGGINYDESRFLAIWEVTQSCDLACRALPGRGAADSALRPAQECRGQGADRPDREDARSDLCPHRRRSAQARRCL